MRQELDQVERARASIRPAYPIESHLVLGIERLAERLRGRPPTTRLGVYITRAPSGGRNE